MKYLVLCILLLTIRVTPADNQPATRASVLIRLLEVSHSPLESSFLIGRFVPIEILEGGGAGRPPREKIIGDEFLVKFNKSQDAHEQTICNVMTSCQEPGRSKVLKLDLVISVPADAPNIPFDAHNDVHRDFSQWIIRSVDIHK